MSDDDEQVGGRFIGKGVYGCVFEPVPRCKDGRTFRRTAGGLPAVGKLASDDITTELRAGKTLMALPDAASYFAVPSESCEPALPIADNEASKCPFLKHPEQQGHEKISMLILPQGGVRINQWGQGRRMATHFERILIHLLEGIALYQSAGLIHNDIHPGNVLVSDSGVGRFIDFGLSFQLATVRKWSDAKQGSRFRPTIVMPPPETFIWQMITNGISVRNGYRQMLAAPGFTTVYPPLERFKQEEFIPEMEAFVRASGDLRSRDGGTFARRFAKKWDTWRLGIVMWDEWNKIIERPHLLRDPEVAEKFWERRDILRTVLRGMTRFDPRKRWSAPRALFELAPSSPFARDPRA